jgi:hypothetical protein
LKSCRRPVADDNRGTALSKLPAFNITTALGNLAPFGIWDWDDGTPVLRYGKTNDAVTDGSLLKIEGTTKFNLLTKRGMMQRVNRGSHKTGEFL